MENEQKCPECRSENIYADRDLWICPDCAHEWTLNSESTMNSTVDQAEQEIRDANGNVLKDGDSVTIVKELKVKGSTSALKLGTKVRNIRLITDASDGHNLACKIDGFGAINLKSEFVRKVT